MQLINTYIMYPVITQCRPGRNGCNRTHTPPHMPTFVSKCDGRTPEFILGE